ncbi:DUF3857 domain-containing protein [Carboxylicivirga sp. RSCT41]|uniref:DUF3857 domain-containing protein n=1 Tax=Carboxylicivirga agarovorans TaxID=3417570 RepID=UPI003D32986B
MRSIFLLTLVLFVSKLTSAQFDDERSSYFKNYYWNQADTTFNNTIVPDKWLEESAVIIAKNVEYSVNKKAAGKLRETYGVHKRVKLLDQNAIDDFSEFSFGTNRKFYAGFFSSATIEYYIGAKVIKPDGTEVIVDNRDAIKKEIGSGRYSYAYNKVAIPDLQIGDIVDFYYCYEKKFPSRSFHSFSPVFYELNEEYPIVDQTLSIDVLRYCYLNAKSINGAPDLKEVPLPDEGGIYRYQLKMQNSEPIKEESWTRISEELPLLKFQAYFLTANNTILDPFESFYGPVTKRKDYINPNSLPQIARSFQNSVVNPYHYFFNVYKATFKYLKALKAQGTVGEDELIKEGYFFLREYWYQQALFVAPQNVYVPNYELDNIMMTSILSAALLKVKCEHEVIFLASKEYTRMSDLLFMEELVPGIKSKADTDVIIIQSGPYSIPNEVPEQYTGVEAYSVVASRKLDEMNRIMIPKANYTNEIKVESQLELNTDSDSLKLKSIFTISGECKSEWDSTLIVKSVFKEEFDAKKYREFIHEANLYANTKAQDRKREKLMLQEASEEKERRDNIKAKLNSYFQSEGISVDTFKLIQSGRWMDQPELIFEVEYKLAGLYEKVGNKSLFSIGKLIGQHGLLQEEERRFNVSFPYKRNITHEITVTGSGLKDVEGLDNLKDNYESDDLSFNVDVESSETILKITTKEAVKNSYIDVGQWSDIRAYYEAIKRFNESKIRF